MNQYNNVRLGLMAPLSGIGKLYGTDISNAGKIACSEINENGGVLGRELELIILDDGSMPETSLPAAERLVREFGCSAIIGNFLSNSRIAISNFVSEPLKIPYLNFSFYEGSLTGRYFFSFGALPNQQIERMVGYMVANIGSKIFFAGNNYEWPRGSIDAGKEALLENYGEVVGEEYLSMGLSMDEIEELLLKVSHSGADIFFPNFAGDDQIRILERFTEIGLKDRMAVAMGHFDEVMASNLSPDVREGLYCCSTYFMTLESEINRSYLSRLASLDGVNGLWPVGDGIATNLGESTYICARAFADAVAAGGSLEPDRIAGSLLKVEIHAPQGLVNIDPSTHHSSVNSHMARCNRDGTFSIIEHFGRIEPVIPERYRRSAMDCRSVDGREIQSRFIEKRSRKTVISISEQNSSNKSEEEKKKGGSSNFLSGFTASGIASEILDTMDVVIIAVDSEGRMLEVNKEACRRFGYEERELIGRSVHMLVPPNLRIRHTVLFNEFVDGNVMEIFIGKHGDIQGYRKDGTVFPAEASIIKFIHDISSVFVVTLRDISDRKKAEETLIWRATHDSLTKLPNRVLIRDRLNSALERSTRFGKNVGLIFIDIDNFKLINDTYGHDTGDRLILSIAERLVSSTRPGDTVARLGGDEFVVLSERIENDEMVIAIASRINEVIRRPFTVDNREIYISASAGMAIGHGSTHSAEDLLRNGDAAMYMAKDKGKDGWHLFSSKIYDNLIEKLSIINGLKTAISRGEFHIVFQPIVSANSRVIKGAESLIRWRREDGSYVSPAYFIPVAESIGAIIPIGLWVFREVCKSVVAIQKIYGDNIPYTSINVSTRQLNEEGIVESIKEIFKETGAHPENIVIEITETALMTDVYKNIRAINDLAAMGIRIAVDDFGTGYSSLSQLLKMPVSIIKIDREFIDGLDKRPESRAITSAVIKMAKVMKKSTIAEGVENEAQLFELQAQGCDTIQGFHFYRPMPFDDYMALLKEKSGIVKDMDLGQNDDHDKDDDQSLNIYTVIYVSRASGSVNQDEIESIVNASRKKNSELCVTGFLIYSEGYFMQLLEGRKEFIEKLIKDITEDTRHEDIRVVLGSFTKERLFTDWTMGYWNMKNVGNDIDFSTWQNERFSLSDLSRDAKLCYALFEAISSKNF